MTIMLLEWIFTSVFLILVVLALRAALGRRMSAKLRYGLWAVVLLRLLVPAQLFTSPIAGTWVITEKRTEHSVAQRPAAPAGDVVGLPVADTAPGTVPNFPSPPAAPDVPEPPDAPDLTKTPAWLGWVWLAGTATAALVLLLSNLRFFRRLRRERIPLEGTDCPLRVYVAVGLPSPCLFGLVRPAVYVTPEAAANPAMLRHVLAHEYTHYKHGDHIWSLLRCAALAVHWWNPLVWLAAVCSRRDGELACDEGALKRLGDGERAAYGGTLLALVTAKPRPGDLFRCATTMAGDKKSLKERISRIAQAPKRVLWAVVVAVLVTALACVCAFGQAEPAEEQDPAPSADPAASADPLDIQVPDLEELLTHFTADTQGVPEDVLYFMGRAAWEKYDEYLSYVETAPYWDVDIGFDGWRVQALNGPWHGTACDMDLEVWQVNYEFHTTTPETAMNLVNGGAYLNDDGWLCPTYPNCTYVIFLANEGGKLGYLTSVMINDCSPENPSGIFYETVAMELERKGLTNSDHLQADLNRNGVPETLQVYMIDGGAGQRLEVWEGEELIFSEDGYYAHAGYNALFLYREEGKDYLLRYHPAMGQGWCTYSYQLFTLENNRETVVRENSLEFDINFQPLMHQSFDAKVINAFMGEINPLLSGSVQLLNTDSDLLSTFEKEGRLYDSLGWLDWWEPTFVRDESKSLLNNLLDFQTAMEKEWYAAEPVLFLMNETKGNDAHVWLRYQDRSTQFDAPWEFRFQPAESVEIQVADLNHDGRDEIAFALIEGQGTGCLVENLYVFDAETLEQYNTSSLNEMVLSSIESTGDEDNFYLQGPGMPGPVTLNKHAPRDNPDAPVADAIGLGDIIQYTVSGGEVYCWLGCDTSGVLLGYEGYLKVWLEFTDEGSFRCTYCDYRGDIEY